MVFFLQLLDKAANFDTQNCSFDFKSDCDVKCYLLGNLVIDNLKQTKKDTCRSKVTAIEHF